MSSSSHKHPQAPVVVDAAPVFEFTAVNSHLYVVGGVLDLTAAGANTHVKIDWDGLTLTGVRVTSGTTGNGVVHSAHIRNCNFTDVSLDLIASGNASAPVDIAADDAAVWKVHDNAFSFNGYAPAGYLTDAATLRMEVAPFVSRTYPIAAAARFAFHDNQIGITDCRPLAAVQASDRSALVSENQCNMYGLQLVGSAAVSQMLDTYFTSKSLTICNQGALNTAGYAHGLAVLQPLGIWGEVLTGSGGDVSYNDGTTTAVCNAFCPGTGCSDPSLLPGATVDETRVGRYFEFSSVAFDIPSTTVTIGFKTEVRSGEAITIETSPVTSIEGTLDHGRCSNRVLNAAPDSTFWQAMHNDGNSQRFGDTTTYWTNATVALLDVDDDDDAGTASLDTATYTGTMTMNDFVTCAGLLAMEGGQISMTFTVVHTELQANGLPNIVAKHEQIVTIFFFNSQVLAIGTAVDPLHVVAAEQIKPVSGVPYPDTTTGTASKIHFPITTYVNHAAGEVAVRIQNPLDLQGDGLLNLASQPVGSPPGTNCTVTSPGAVMSCESFLSFGITEDCINDGTGVYSDALHCKQVLTITTDRGYDHVALSGNIGLQVRDRLGDGHLMRTATMAFTLAYRKTVEQTTGGSNPTAGVVVGVEVLSEMSQIGFPTQTLPGTRSFVEGEEMLLYFYIANPSNVTWNKVGIDIVQAVYCGVDPLSGNAVGTPSQSTPDVSGCNAFIPFGKREPVAGWREGSACDSTALTTTTYDFACDSNDGVQYYNVNPILGRCSGGAFAGQKCIIADHVNSFPLTAYGAVSCGAGTCKSNSAATTSATDLHVTDMPRLPNDLLHRHCYDGATLIDCNAATTSCTTPAKCSRSAGHVVLRMRAPVVAFGGTAATDVRYSNVTFNFQAVVYGLDDTAWPAQLLDPGADAVARRRNLLAQREHVTLKEKTKDTALMRLRNTATTVNEPSVNALSITFGVIPDPAKHAERREKYLEDRAQKHLRGRNRENSRDTNPDALSSGRIGIDSQNAVSERDAKAIKDVNTATSTLHGLVAGLIGVACIGLVLAAVVSNHSPTATAIAKRARGGKAEGLLSTSL